MSWQRLISGFDRATVAVQDAQLLTLITIPARSTPSRIVSQLNNGCVKVGGEFRSLSALARFPQICLCVIAGGQRFVWV